MTDKLKKFTLSQDPKRGDWPLKRDGSDRAVARFETKAAATAGGVLSGAIGKQGGSVKIKKTDGTYQEERTFPRSRDPKKSPG
jgi:hypothetical protein